MKTKALCLGVLIILCSSFIITRHDLEDQRYLDYGKNGGFESIAIFQDGNGALIDPQWIITAAHIADDQKPGSPVHIGGKEYKVAKVVTYPQIPTSDLLKKKDIGLVKLDRKVESITPVKYAERMPEPGTIIHLAGNGDTGNGKTGPTRSDRKVRAATNSIDDVTQMHIKFTFNDPASGKATKLEGISGPGDSGSPAYIKKDGLLTVIGVSSFQLVEDNGKEGHYGVIENYHNVATYKDWIAATLKGEDYYKTSMDGKEIVWKRRVDGSNFLSVDGKKAVVDELVKYGEKVINEYRAVRMAQEEGLQEAPDPNDPLMALRKYIEQLAEVDDINKVGGFVLDAKSFMIGNKEMSKELRDKALKKFEELFGQPLGNNRINARPVKN